MRKQNPQLDFSFNEYQESQNNLFKAKSENQSNKIKNPHINNLESEENEEVSQEDFLKNLFYNNDNNLEIHETKQKPSNNANSNQQPFQNSISFQKQEKIPDPDPQHVQCPICGKSISIEEIAAHCDQCSNKMEEVKCQYCNEMIIHQFMDDHLEECIGKIEQQFNQIEKKQQKVNLECAICTLDINLKEDRTILPCFHQFHIDCISQWFQKSKTCPICLTNVE